MAITPFLQFIFIYVPLFLAHCSASLRGQQLHTNSRWIVNQQGKRVKLACVNWPSHLQTMLAEGLNKQPAAEIAKKVRKMGFNCVRFTWPLYLTNNASLSSLTVNETFQNYGLQQSLAGIVSNNPTFVNLTIMDAFKAMLATMKMYKLMVIVDNHLTVPGWCCNRKDGNGFFNDKYFNPEYWKHGLQTMATLVKDYPNVVGMSLRNELRGPRENPRDWYRYMQEGAETINSANPSVLVILSGLNFDKEFRFLKSKPVNVSFSRKLVFEMHWYSFSNSDAWANHSLNDACGIASNEILDKNAFLTEKGFEYPLFVSEVGVDIHTGGALRQVDNGFLGCFMGMAAERDWDFGVWSLQGSYYLREGKIGMEERFGLLDSSWSHVRNQKYLRRISVLQKPFRGPGWEQIDVHKAIFHPETGLCVVRGKFQALRLGPCSKHTPFLYTTEKKLKLMDNSYYLSALHINDEAILHPFPYGKGSVWETISNSKMHLSTKDVDGNAACLDVDKKNNLIANACKCLSGDKTCEPTSQWFKLVDTTVIDPKYSP